MTRLAWLLVIAGALLVLVFGWSGYGAYQSVVAMDVAAGVETPNVLALFDDLTSNGIRINNQVDARFRGAYGAALEQFVLNGTGALLGFVLAGGGVYLSLVSDR